MSEVEVACIRPGCGDPYSAHLRAGVRSGDLPGCSRPGCSCRGFIWVDPDGQAVGSYTDPPARGGPTG